MVNSVLCTEFHLFQSFQESLSFSEERCAFETFGISAMPVLFHECELQGAEERVFNEDRSSGTQSQKTKMMVVVHLLLL